MAIFKHGRGRRYMMHLIVKLICCLGWLTDTVYGQIDISGIVTDSASFPDLGLTCIGNLAVFFTSFLRGRLDLEIGARDVMATLTGPELKKINGIEDINCFALTTCRKHEGPKECSVVMLSREKPNSSMGQFIKYIDNVYGVRSILLQCLPLESVVLTLEICACLDHTESSPSNNIRKCGCIVFWRGMDDIITIMLAERMPGTLKLLSDSLCLLPSRRCLKHGCHGCNKDLLHVETNQNGSKSFTEGNPEVESPAAACLTLDFISRESFLGGPATCICIPVHGARDADWTKMLIRSFKPKDNETRASIIRHAFSSVSDALENSMAPSGECYAKEEYNTASLIVPRLTEILINVVLTFWFKVDGFSSALVARRAVRDYTLDNKGSGFAAHVFMSLVEVRSNANKTNFFQVFTFRGNFLSLRTLSCIVGCVNLICSVSWAVLVALEGGTNKWYYTHSMPPSKPRIAVITVAIAIALGMDCFDLILYLSNRGLSRYRRKTLLVCGVIVLEIACIVSGSALASVLGIKVFGRWIYSALQALVWVKWGISCYLLGQYPPEHGGTAWWRGGGGMYMYSSAFMLNAILAGVRAKWKYS